MPQAAIEAPFYPIIYVRGYAGSQGEVEDTAADPYMGFNLGATKLRQLWDGTCQRHYFESPLVRLMKDYGYRDVYVGGAMMPPTLRVGLNDSKYSAIARAPWRAASTPGQVAARPRITTGCAAGRISSWKRAKSTPSTSAS